MRRQTRFPGKENTRPATATVAGRVQTVNRKSRACPLARAAQDTRCSLGFSISSLLKNDEERSKHPYDPRSNTKIHEVTRIKAFFFAWFRDASCDFVDRITSSAACREFSASNIDRVQSSLGLQVITPSLDDGVRDATARSDGVEGRMAGEPSHSFEKRSGFTVVCQRRHDLPGRVFHAIRRIAGVDSSYVNGRCPVVFGRFAASRQ